MKNIITLAAFVVGSTMAFADDIKDSGSSSAVMNSGYDLNSLLPGEYTIQIEDPDGIHTETIDYRNDNSSKKIAITKSDANDGRYILSGFLPSSETLSINVYNADNKIIFHENVAAEGKFAKLYNLSSLKGGFSIEVSDSSGTLKDFNSETR